MKLEKIIELRKPADKRWYDDACGTALAMELVGERWSLLIVRELMFGPRRFGELRGGLTGISANVLTQRLEGLERAGIVARRKLPPPANVQVYELTEWGYEAEVVIQVLGRWAVRSPEHDPTLPLSAASIMMSFRTMFDPARANGQPVAIRFRFGAESFVARIAGDRLTVTRGEADGVDATLTTDPMTLGALVYGGMPLAEAQGSGAVGVEGDLSALGRFAAHFALPEKAGTPP